MELKLTQLPKHIRQRRPELLPLIIEKAKQKEYITIHDVIKLDTSYYTARILLNYLTQIGILDMFQLGNVKVYKLKKKQ